MLTKIPGNMVVRPDSTTWRTIHCGCKRHNSGTRLEQHFHATERHATTEMMFLTGSSQVFSLSNSAIDLCTVSVISRNRHQNRNRVDGQAPVFSLEHHFNPPAQGGCTKNQCWKHRSFSGSAQTCSTTAPHFKCFRVTPEGSVAAQHFTLNFVIETGSAADRSRSFFFFFESTVSEGARKQCT